MSRIRLALLSALLLAAALGVGLLLRQPLREDRSPEASPPVAADSAGGGATVEAAPIALGKAASARPPEPAAPRAAREPSPGPAGAPASGGAQLAGTVTGDGGAPVEGVTLRLECEDGVPAAPPGAVTRSNARGEYRFPGLPAGRWTLSTRKAGWLAAVVRGVETPRAEPLAVVLSPDRPVPVRVVDRAGVPVSGASIVVRPGGQTMARAPLGLSVRAKTGADGRGELRGLPADGALQLAITAAAKGRPRVELVRSASELRAGTLEIVLGGGAVLNGIVVDAEGKPVADASLVLAASGAQGGAPEARRTLHSTSTGAFRFEGVPEGGFTLYADGGDRGRAKREGLLTEGGSSDAIVVSLAPAGSPEALAAAPPAPAATVRPLRAGGAGGAGSIRGRVVGEVPTIPYAIGLARDGAPDDELERVFRQSARRGEFLLPNVPPGAWRVLLLLDDEVRARAESVKVEAGREAGPVELRPEG